MRKNQKGIWTKTRAASTWAVSALLALQLTGTALPSALARELSNGPNQVEPPVEVIEKPDPIATESTPAEQVMPDNELALVVQNAQDPLTFIDQNGSAATCESYTLIAAEPAGDDPIVLANDSWYVVRGQVNASKRIEVQGSARLIMCDNAQLIAEKGIHSANESTLSIFGQAQHTGKLEATGDEQNAGIGGNMGERGGTFYAYGAHTIAQGGKYAAGIGGGQTESGGTVLIRGEATQVEATGGEYGAGIGGGCGTDWKEISGTGYTGTVTIEGGSVTAQGGLCGAGIGGGNGYGADSGGGTVTISSGIVTATGGKGGAGIGGANGYINKGVGHTTGADVTITGGIVNATGGVNNPGIGTGSHNASGGSLTITGGTVTATGGSSGAGIGGGYVDRSLHDEDGDYPVTITGGTVTAKPGGESNAAGIGGGLYGNGITVKIGGTAHVEAYGGQNSAGIGSADHGTDAGSLEVTGGTVIAKSGMNAAGIGSGQSFYDRGTVGPTVVITGGIVEAYGNQQGAGIGGGEYASGGNVTITGGKVLADGTSRYSSEVMGGAGIGAGCGISSDDMDPTTGGTVYIGGDAEVTAIGGRWCAGIGGGLRGNGANVTIGGNATVKATGGEGGAGIGGGWGDPSNIGGMGGEVKVQGGTVTAQAGAPKDNSPAAAIGHGSGRNGASAIELYDAAMVRHGSQANGADATISVAAQRASDCGDFWAQISPCNHKDAAGASTATFEPTANRLHHTRGCTQCLFVPSNEDGKPTEFDHQFNTDGDCACGVHARKVLFNKNAATAKGSMTNPFFVVENTEGTLPTCGFSRSGYAFAGWNTKANGKGKAYANKAAIAVGTADVSLYAQWKPSKFGTISGVPASYVYNGKPHQPKPNVKGPEGQALKEGTDYKLEYANNVNATTGSSKAKVRVVGVGEYADAATATVEFVIKKSTPAAPAKPAKKSATASSITVRGNKGCEYSINGGKTWKKLAANGTVTFEGLKPKTAYSIVGRVRATANTNPSKASKALRVSTSKPKASTSYKTYVQGKGWGATAKNGGVCGTVGKAKRMEAFTLSVASNIDGGVSYRAHVSGKGWLDWVRDGKIGGTTKQGRRLEAVQIRLYGDLAKEYDVYYCVHVQGLGWMDWTRNGKSAGTVGESRRVEAIRVALVEKGASVTTSHEAGQKYFPRAFRQNGPSAA